MENKFLLSICIPTYNRANYLKNCLDSIFIQLDDEKVKNLIEIVVSDNASQDNTFNLVKNYQSNFINLKYFRNQENIGMDDNVTNSVMKATGKYCWHIGDDDAIQNGSLSILIEVLQKKEVALLGIHFYPFIDIAKALEKKVFNSENFVEYLNSAEEFCNKNYCIATLGALIVNRKLWLAVDKSNYQTYFNYYEFALKMIGNTILPLGYIKTPLLYTGQDYRWAENGGTFLTAINFVKIWEKLGAFGYSKKFIDYNTNRFSKSLPMALLIAKTFGLKCSFTNLKRIYHVFYKYPLPLFIATLVFFIPNSVVKFGKLLHNKIRKIA